LNVPDDYLVERLGLAGYYARVVADLKRAEPGTVDHDREQEMAAHLRVLLASHEKVLLVCGLAHLQGILAHLETGVAVPPGGVTQREHALYAIAADSVPHVLDGMPYMVYAYELSRRGERPEDHPALAPLPTARGGELLAARDAFREALTEILPRMRLGARDTPAPEDFDILADLVRGAVRLYDREWNEQPGTPRLQTLLRFARNQALVQRRLVPSKYQLVLAAKNTVNDDYAYQVLRLADHYPFQEEESQLPEMRIESDGSGEADGETLMLRLRMPRALQEHLEAEALDLEDPPDEVDPGSWQEHWEEGMNHVSHPPQDIRVEDFFTYLRNKCRRIVADQQVRHQELQASLMDGLDVRETLRNLPRGKIFVRENLPAVGDVGPLVIIFHGPGQEQEYPHEMMWYAEHAKESDLALYSTEPGRWLDGPGISRCQYGGLLSLYPPTGRVRVWGNPRYEGPHSRAETLLKAALDLSQKPIVAYAAPQGPSPEMQARAAAKGLRILHIPLDSLSGDLLKRVRTFHILADRYLRPLAFRYIRD
ncbi:MAG: hypothetical protein OEW39_08140, partial [Deltaproteobacteria bacterium]|nr:hypothetical protein [Deltaproteobacteria bacterium]